MRIALLAALLVVSRAEAGPAGAQEFARTPAGELLAALGLHPVAPRDEVTVGPELPRPDGSYAARLTLARPPGPAFSARGPAILQSELVDPRRFDLRSFELLYDARGRLVAVFPVLPDGASLSRERWTQIRPRVLDLSPYYVEVPRPGEPGALDRWRAFAAAYARDQALLAAFAAERYGALLAAYPEFLGQELPYRLHELDPRTGAWEAFGFSPGVFAPAPEGFVSELEPAELLARFAAGRPGIRRAVIPKFPSVYVLATFTPDEVGYMRGVLKRFALSADARILVVGPGTGIDCWVASLRTTAPVSAVGINPLEVANTKAAARSAGFEVRAIVGDNIVDEAGSPRFPGERFDAVFWSMPSYRPAPLPEARPGLAEAWDGDVGGAALKRLARGLPSVLSVKGVALLWNYAALGPDGGDEVAEILRYAQTDAPVFSVFVESFPKPRRGGPAAWYPGRVYAVER